MNDGGEGEDAAPSATPRPRAEHVAIGLLLAVRLCVAEHPPALADALFLVGLALLLALAHVRDAPLSLRAPHGVALVIAGLLLASAALSWHPLLSALMAPAALGALAAFLAIVALAARTAALWSVAVAGAVHASVGLWQRLYSWPALLGGLDEATTDPAVVARLRDMRPFGLSFSPDLFAAVCLGAVGAGLAIALDRSARARPLAAACAVLAVVGVFLSRSAGGGLALGALVVFAALLGFLGRVRALYALVIFPLTLTVPVAVLAVVGRGREALLTSAGERLHNWQVGWQAFTDAPLLGAGWGRFAAAYLAHRTPDANVTRYAHSFPVQTLVEGGALLGGGLLAVLVLALALIVRRHVLRSPSPARNALLATVLALVVRTTFDYDAQIAQTLTLLAVLFGAAWLDVRRATLLTSGKAAPPRPGIARPLALALVAGLLAWGAAAAAALSARDAALEPFARGADEPPGAREVEALRAYVARVPSDPQAAGLLATIFGRELTTCRSGCEALRAEVEAFVERATRGDHPAPDVLVLKAQLAWAEDRQEDAERALLRALEIDPANRRVHRARIAWARDQGDKRLAYWVEAAKRWGIELPPARATR